jgi:parvulin-like peptidyl-prolyl isomerase
MRTLHGFTILLATGVLLAGCAGLPFAPAAATPVPPTPSPTPEPAAALVNGTVILLADFEQEVARYEAAQRSLGIDLATQGDYRAAILSALIDRRLLADAARSAGDSLEPAQVEARIEALAAEMGGSDAMGAWLAANGYSLEGLKASLGEEILAALMVQRIADEVPTTAEQVHARHILVADAALAEELQSELAGGADFAALAQTYSLDLSTRIAGGDLGWFAPGTLTTPEVEAAAFALQPGEIGAIVQSALGYHLIEVLERGDHALSPETWRRLRQAAVDDWLTEQHSKATIEIVITP